MERLALLLALAILGIPAVRAEEATAVPDAPRVQTLKDIAYFEGPDADPVKHKLDLYLPRDAKDYPVLVFLHGGAWRRGDKSGHFGVYASLGKTLARQGIGVVVANYRLSPQVKHPEHIRDVARAFGWVCGNIARHGGNPRRVFVGGHSAGGHLASLLATDESHLKAVGRSCRDVCGIVSLSGVYFLPEPHFAAVFGERGPERRKAWPLEHVKPGLPPFLLMCADNDLPGCDRAPAETFCRALRDKGNQAELIEARDSTHIKIMMSAALPDDPVARAVVQFIRKTAKIDP